MFGNEAIRADVVFQTDEGAFSAQMRGIRAEAERTYGAMSNQALRLAVAEEKYTRALENNKVGSYRANRATVAYRNEVASLAAESTRASGAIQSEERSLGRIAKGAIAGSGALGSLRRAAVFASTSFLGGYGLVYALRSAVDAAREQEVALAHLDQALTVTGNTSAAVRRQVADAVDEQRRNSGFTDTEITESLATFVRRYGDVNQALRANAIAADVARAKNVSLADAQTLVLRASFGNPRSLRQLGIDITKTTANTDRLKQTTAHATAVQIANAKAADLQANETRALDAVYAKFHGNAAKFLQTSAGKQALFDAELQHSKEIIGDSLLPTLNLYLARGDKWLTQMDASGRLQKDVNSIVQDGKTFVHDLGVAWHGVEPILHAVTTAFGGTGHALSTLFELMVARKVLAFGASFTTAGAEAAAGGRRISASIDAINLAPAEDKIAALQAQIDALHGKTVVVNVDENVTTTGGGVILPSRGGGSAAAGVAGTVAKDAGKLTLAGILRSGLRGGSSLLKGAAGDALTGALILSLVPGSKQGQQDLNDYGVGGLGKIPFVGGAEQQVARAAVGLGTAFDHLVGTMSPSEKKAANTRLLASILPGALERTTDLAGFNAYLRTFGLSPLSPSQYGQIYDAYFKLKNAVNVNPPGVKGAFFTPGSRSGKGRGGGGGQLVLGLSYARQNALLRAESTAGTADDRAELERELTILTGALGQHGLTPAQTNSLLSQRNSVLDQIRSIDQTNSSAASEAERKRQEEAKKKLAAEQKARRQRITRLENVPADLRIEYANAVARGAAETKLVSILEAEKKALDKQVAILKKIGASKDDIAKAREHEAQIQTKINALTKKKSGSGQLGAEFLDAFVALNQFAPNYQDAQKPTVTINQTFHDPTVDRHREAHLARVQMQAVGYG